jgi:Secretion system C-terminal sorting domain
MYPNPASENVVLNGLQPNDEIQLIDGVGKILLSKIASDNHQIIYAKQYVNGLYYMRIQRKSIITMTKLQINH